MQISSLIQIIHHSVKTNLLCNPCSLLSKDAQRLFYRYLELRGVNSSTTSSIYEYMLQKVKSERAGDFYKKFVKMVKASRAGLISVVVV